LKLVQKTGVQETNQLVQKAVDTNNLLSAEELARKFMGELQKCLQQCQQEAHNRVAYSNDDDARWKLEQLRHIDDRIKLRSHGPAIQMDVNYLWPTPQKLFYSVDMVPTIQISNRSGEYEYYVAKPIKEAPELANQSGLAWNHYFLPTQNEWRRSFSLEEKRRLVNFDQDQGCRKQVLRVLKVLKNREPGLKLLTSYHFKTVLFRKADELRDPEQWSYKFLGQRLMDIITQIEEELSERVMPHYFLPGVNLLDGMSEIAIFNLRQRLINLKNRKQAMMTLLQV